MMYCLLIQNTYRSDLLAFDMYGDKNLWWVFPQRNIEKLKDPTYDFEAGTEILVPKGPCVKRLLGL